MAFPTANFFFFPSPFSIFTHVNADSFERMSEAFSNSKELLSEFGSFVLEEGRERLQPCIMRVALLKHRLAQKIVHGLRGTPATPHLPASTTRRALAAAAASGSVSADAALELAEAGCAAPGTAPPEEETDDAEADGPATSGANERI